MRAICSATQNLQRVKTLWRKGGEQKKESEITPMHDDYTAIASLLQLGWDAIVFLASLKNE